MPTTSTTPAPRFQRDSYTRFAHLFPRDAELWKRYLLTPDSTQYIGFDYDIKVGKHALAAIHTPSPQANLEAGTLAKRIDVVAFLDNTTVDLIEVKPHQPALAAGQLNLYLNLFNITYPHLYVRKLRLITASIDDEAIAIVKSQSIDVAQLP